eukprot:PhF_6_TR42877/c0_g1_i1/m.64959
MDHADIKRKILEGKKRQKEELLAAKEEEDVQLENLSGVDRAVLLGVPFMCTAVLLGEPHIDFLVIGLLLGIDAVFFYLFYVPGVMERASYFVLNLCIMLSGDRIRELDKLPDLMSPVNWAIVITSNVAIVCTFYFAWIRYGEKKQDRSQRWDVALIVTLCLDMAALMYFGGVTAHELIYRTATIRKLFGM